MPTASPGSRSSLILSHLAGVHAAARAAVALDKFVDEYNLDGLAYYYEGEEGSEIRQLVTNLIVGNSLLIAAGFPMCGESDLKTCIAMLIEDRLDIGGSFAEFHPIDFHEGFVLVGHDGPHHDHHDYPNNDCLDGTGTGDMRASQLPAVDPSGASDRRPARCFEGTPRQLHAAARHDRDRLD